MSATTEPASTGQTRPGLAHLWRDVLRQLELQMARQTFTDLLTGARLLSLNRNPAGQVAVGAVGVKSVFAKEWLESRLKASIERVMENVVGQPVALTFVVDENGAPSVPPTATPDETGVQQQVADMPAEMRQELLTTGQKLAQADPYAAHFDKGGAGYMMVSNYQNIFWLAYLGGEAYALWQRLANERVATIRQPQDRWTEPKRYSYREMAGWLNLSHPCYVSGCIRECHNSRLHIAETGQEISPCCHNHYPQARVKLDGDGRQRCMYWKTGLLQILHAQALVAVKEVKSANKQAARAHVLEIQTWRALPPLTPHQLQILSSDLQQAHDRWIETWGPKLYGVTLTEWKETAETIIVPLMDGHAAYRKLNGPYRPDEYFHRLERRRWENEIAPAFRES